ncbi:MAG TPA: hydroxymethylbilane synthase [Thermodesulfobacteriota bacterium]|nr:hydroxymethylbilane synthase [Thermodesulfobacteriota bacterium]
MRQALRIGSRGSRLALLQAEFIRSLIKSKFPEITTELHIIRTTGDKILDSQLSEIGGKGVFVKEIEDALIRNEIDIAVHSMKDLPTILPNGLTIGAVAERHDPRDVLVSKNDIKFNELPKGAKVGTSSLRRQAQLLNLRPDLQILPLRGNVDTRVRKVRSEGLDSAVLALAGLERMGFKDEIAEIFPVDVLVPAPGQGALAVECREDDREINDIIFQINHKESSISASAERAFLAELGGGCQVPVGCYARIKKDRINILGLIASTDGREIIREEIDGSVEIHQALGRELALTILNKGGREILSKGVG